MEDIHHCNCDNLSAVGEQPRLLLATRLSFTRVPAERRGPSNRKKTRLVAHHIMSGALSLSARCIRMQRPTKSREKGCRPCQLETAGQVCQVTKVVVDDHTVVSVNRLGSCDNAVFQPGSVPLLSWCVPVQLFTSGSHNLTSPVPGGIERWPKTVI